MTVEPRPDQVVQSVWQQQPSEGRGPSIENIRRQAGKFDRQIAWRNVREYAGALVAAVCFAAIFWGASDVLVRVGAASIVAGLLYVVWHLHAQGASRRLPAELGQTTGLEFLKADLARQRDLLRGVWRWYLGPPLPGMVLLFVATARANHASAATWANAVSAAVIALVFVVVGQVNARAAKALQARIDELDALQAPR